MRMFTRLDNFPLCVLWNILSAFLVHSHGRLLSWVWFAMYVVHKGKKFIFARIMIALISHPHTFQLDGCTTEDVSPIYYGGLPTPPYAPMLYHYALVSTFEHCGFIVVLLTHLDQPTTNEDNGAMGVIKNEGLHIHDQCYMIGYSSLPTSHGNSHSSSL
ncbi:hypothetical protein Syun_012128 [Stephania yunnanensis]|uniref:Uncharacterized protein n=1 Tax=Stephania yunnanensis TaxID=152371 RepID=A0AAP0K0A5_9MAGN